MYEEAFQKILSLVKDELAAKTLFRLLTEEVYDNLFLGLAKVSTQEEIKIYENRIREAKSPQHAQTIIDEISLTVYGDNAKEQLQNEYNRLVAEIENTLNDARGLVQKAKQGDSQAQQQIENAKQNPLYQKINPSQYQ